MLDRLAREVEALLMASETSLSIEYLCELTGSGRESVEQAIDRIGKSLDTEGHSITVLDIAGGYRLATRQEYGNQVSQLFEGRRPGRLTRAALETLAVIAYSQPCTRASIESVRGVNCDSALRTLLERELARIEGRQETPGRPLLYATTNRFLEYFGLSTLDHLPRLDEIGELLAGGLDEIEAGLLTLEHDLNAEEEIREN
jgi:segregation and condensation protein B